MRVSIGLPFYNEEANLPDAIRSVFAQSFQDWELILLDDGSTDGSLDIAHSVCDPRVRVISDGINRHLHYRLNQLAGLSRGEYMARMDADDIMHPQRLEKQVRMLDENPDLDVIGTAVYTIDDANVPNGIRGMGTLNISPQIVLSRAIMVHSTVIARAEWFRKNPYDETYLRAEDYELWCRTVSTSSFASISEPLFYYREGATPPWEYLEDYLQSVRTIKRIVRTYGPATVGWSDTLRLMFRYTLKAQAYKFATLLGKQSALIRKRNVPINEQEYQAALEGLSEVMQTQVPGLPPVHHTEHHTTSTG